jgi:membrane-associated phospholipid phosphatase
MLTFQSIISQLSGPEVMFGLAIIFAVALYREKDRKDFYTILFASTTAMCATYFLKYYYKIPRPNTMLVTASDYRFPSGHATMAAVIMTLGIYYTHTHIKNRHVRYFLDICAIGWFVLVSYSRIYLGAHYPIDIIVGGGIGVVATITTIYIIKSLKRSK